MSVLHQRPQPSEVAEGKKGAEVPAQLEPLRPMDLFSIGVPGENGVTMMTTASLPDGRARNSKGRDKATTDRMGGNKNEYTRSHIGPEFQVNK